MSSYLFTYIILIFLSFICSKSKNVNDTVCITLLPISVFFIFCFALRNSSVGTDTPNYIEYFYLDWNGYSGKIEPLYLLLNKVFHFLFNNYIFFFTFEAIIIIISTFCISSKSSYCMCFPLAFALLYVPSLNIQRQVLAISFSLIFLYRTSRYNFLNLFFLSLCCFIHNSTVFFVLIYIFSPFLKLSNKFYKFIFLLCFVLVYFGLFDKVLFNVISFTPYKGYIDFFYEAGSKKLKISILNSIKWIIYFHLFDYTNKNPKRCLYNNFILLMFITDLLVKQYPFLFRVSYLFSSMIIPCMKLVCDKIVIEKKLIDKVFCFFVLLFYSMQFMANLSLGQNEVIPFCFSEL